MRTLYKGTDTIPLKHAALEHLERRSDRAVQGAPVSQKMEDDGYKNRTSIIGNKVEVSGRITRYFEAARAQANNSVYGKLRHGAVLVKGGSILNAGYNKDDYTSYANRYRPPDCGPATRHAEAECLLGISKSQTSRSDIFVCRINNDGEFRLSKPCLMCHVLIKNAGIKRVFYTTNHSGIEMYKL
jgi:deoxycytidylate deaminase